MTRLNKAIAAQLGALAVLVVAAVTSQRWVPWLVHDPDIGTGLLVVGTFGIGIVALSVGIIWATFLSWFEYRRGAFQALGDRITMLTGATIGGCLVVYALQYWGAL